MWMLRRFFDLTMRRWDICTAPRKVGRESVRYPGTLLKYSVSECNQTKSLHLVTLEKRRAAPVEVETYPLHPLRDVKKFRGNTKGIVENCS